MRVLVERAWLPTAVRPFVVRVGDGLLLNKRGIVRRFASEDAARRAGERAAPGLRRRRERAVRKAVGRC